MAVCLERFVYYMPMKKIKSKKEIKAHAVG